MIRVILHLGFTCLFIFHFAPVTSSEVPNADNTLVFCGKNICYTVSPRRSWKFLKFPSTPRETAANSVRSFSVCHFKTFLSVTCMSLFWGCGWVVSLSFTGVICFRRRTCTRHPVVHLDIRRTAITSPRGTRRLYHAAAAAADTTFPIEFKLVAYGCFTVVISIFYLYFI